MAQERLVAFSTQIKFLQDDNGFKYACNGPLYIRMYQLSVTSKANEVNKLLEADLADLIFQFGEDRNSRKISSTIMTPHASTLITRKEGSKLSVPEIDTKTSIFSFPVTNKSPLRTKLHRPARTTQSRGGATHLRVASRFILEFKSLSFHHQ